MRKIYQFVWDYSRIVSESKDKGKFGEGLKILSPK